MLQTILTFVAAVLVPLFTVLGIWVKAKVDARDDRAIIAADLDLIDRLPEGRARRALQRAVDERAELLAAPTVGWSPVQLWTRFLPVAAVLLAVIYVVDKTASEQWKDRWEASLKVGLIVVLWGFGAYCGRGPARVITLDDCGRGMRVRKGWAPGSLQGTSRR